MPLNLIQLQQSLPFTVLKLSSSFCLSSLIILAVATALTVYGIETRFLLRDIVFHKWLVATALTVYGIETFLSPDIMTDIISLQQPLPFTVLKPALPDGQKHHLLQCCNSPYRLRYWNSGHSTLMPPSISVATVLIVYGIETWTTINSPPSSLLKLQQYLLFTVLKHSY